MCKFCEVLKWEEYKVLVRTTATEDNVCEKLSPLKYEDGTIDENASDCKGCNGCAEDNNLFTLTGYKVDDNSYIQLGYIHKIRDTNILPYSESLHINYCPWCGEKISKNEIKFEDVHYISKKESKGEQL